MYMKWCEKFSLPVLALVAIRRKTVSAGKELCTNKKMRRNARRTPRDGGKRLLL